jgi:ketosteroid isomerase-like protein
MASRDSVTVSIAALSNGTLTEMFLVTREDTSTALGSTSECRGTSSTSSKVRAVVSPMAI